ncbi:MAG: DUF6691 family protein [Myxococcota bacterium]
MKSIFSALLVGLLFGLGLGISGMTQADKVVGFLNLSSAWDPSLACVMGGAIAVHVVLYRWILKRPSPLFAAAFAIPKRVDLDGRLLAGAALFGVGWALGGYCPGPGLVSVASFSPHALVFMGCLTLGMMALGLVDRLNPKRSSA